MPERLVGHRPLLLAGRLGRHGALQDLCGRPEPEVWVELVFHRWRQKMRTLNIGIVGYGFMGRAHSNAYRQVNRFFDLDIEPVLKAACGRQEQKTEEFARRWGWQ